ncbi:hypothetical protein IMX26_10620 [Clostridium sp. 'deep sea']|uniref:hypothetical protein n=1 Tax=Clostridium sp. 'deep sea' TaxID=2779445 RepID=UPI0018969FF6|nr:hypothetical protein [Clostridium sp. 'deep sea']QOR33945.1 hypothetical protein IMX26_10620 [Clostridium sp. 'deep sea']
MANYCHYALHKLKILPSQFMNLSRAEQAFIMASIDEYLRAEKIRAMKIRSRR